MCDEFESLAVSDMFYPEWWNVNTHRSNHVNRTPLFQANYGMGRALFGDWGRVGAVKARSDSDGVKARGSFWFHASLFLYRLHE